MATSESPNEQVLAPPAVTALRQEGAGAPVAMERTHSMDMREERQDLREAAEQSLNVILDLGLDGKIRWVSPSWKDVVGTPVESVKNRPIADILLSNNDAFTNAVESMKKDDSKSRIIRFKVHMGVSSVLRQDTVKNDDPPEGSDGEEGIAEEEQELNLEGQGIMVYDRSSGDDSHTMWMLRPSNPPREITIDLPELLVESLGLGAEILAHYLTSLAESGANDPENHPPPLPVLCRICERQITPWWFEKHSDGCTQEYRAEEAITIAQEALVAHRPAIVKVLDSLDPESRQSRSIPGENASPAPSAEYKGMSIGPSASSPASDSGRVSPATPSRSRDPSSSGLGYARGKSFTVRRPLYRVAELIIDLCDTAIAINTAAIKENRTHEDADGDIRSSSPHSHSLIQQIQQWSSPSASTLDQEPGLAALTTDTENLARTKVEAVLRHREIIEYTERIRVEFNNLVLDCIDAALQKAKKIKEGQLSDSSSEDEIEEEAQTPAASETSFPVSAYDGPSAMTSALRNVSDPSLVAQFERRQSSSAAVSSRSSSPMECPTPRSHTNSISFLGRSESVNKRSSAYLGSDAGDSDTNVSHPVLIGGRRTQSPSADLALARSASSSERKRRSLRLPNMPSPHRQPSPARTPAPSSPLKIPKPRPPLGLESLPSLPSPVTSPPLSSTEMSSPIVPAQHHRRQSSAASSAADLAKPPLSPRPAGISQPPARAVPPSIKDFEIIKPISKGAFGSVYLSKKKSTGDYFAIKVLRKADMVAKNQVTNVKAERAIMMWQGESEFVAKLYWTFSSKDYLFLVMEYLNGGDCAALIKVLGGLPEDWSKKYMAEVVLGVEHLHSRGIVHRDLKPDNLLIDQKGHLKLTDFGLSRMGLIGRQKRALKSPNQSTPDLLKYGPFARASSMTSSRSTSFDLQGTHSPQSTPVMTPDLAGSLGQPSYFSLNRETILGREHSKRKSGYRSDSGNSDSFSAMFRNFSLNDEPPQRGARIDEETQSEGEGSPDPFALQKTISNLSNLPDTPPQSSMLPPPMALFDPEDQNRRFVGTPDYLAPETINGLGQDEMSDWWSLGCILFEFLFGYPPFHGVTPEKVFENILARKIYWPEDDGSLASEEAKDLMTKLMTLDPKERLGANMDEKYSTGGEEIRQHPWFNGTNWETLLDDQAQFVPAPENPEDTEYFDTRGATLQTFTEEMEDQASSPSVTPGPADYQDRPHDALSRVRSQVNSPKRGLMPLHIPAHVRDGRSRRLSEPVATDDFGNFAFKNLPVLEKANQDVLQKLLADSAQRPNRHSTSSQSPGPGSAVPSLEGSPLIPMPLKRARSTNKGNRPASPSTLSHSNASPNRASQPSSPLLVSFSTGQNHERRKTSSTSSTLSHQSSNSLQPGQFFDVPRLPAGASATAATPSTSSPIKMNRNSMVMPITSPDRSVGMPRPQRPHSIHASFSRARSQTVGSQEEAIPPSKPFHNKRQSQVFDISPSSSDNDDPRAKALLRVQRRRQSSRRMSQIMLAEGPTFRPLDVLICEDHVVSRMMMEKLLERLRCRTIIVKDGTEAARYAMSEVQFDIIMMEYKLEQINGTDLARMIRDTKSANTQTPIICITGYLKELPQTHHFDSLIEKPPTVDKLTEALCNLCAWKPPPAGYDPQKQQQLEQQKLIPSGLRQESRHAEDSPSSQSSGPFTHMPGLYKQPSREHSIGSSFFGDTDSTNTEDVPLIINKQSDDWASNGGLMISEDPSPPDTSFMHPGLPHLIHQNSAPPTMDRTPRKQRSVEAVKAKRENLEKNRHECAESGDDEDEELGKLPSRARSPQGRYRGSKLGVEMMRTNSRGSVSSGGADELSSNKEASNVTSNLDIEISDAGKEHATIEPPELFAKEAKGETVEVIDMDATPRPSTVAANTAIEQSAMEQFARSPSPQKK